MISVGIPDYEAAVVGGKAVGELGIVGVAPAIANAVFHATGKRIRDLPITLEKLISSLGRVVQGKGQGKVKPSPRSGEGVISKK